MPASRPPAAPSRWPVIDLVDDIASLLRVLAEAALDGDRLDLVVERRRGAVRVDVVDLVGLRCRPCAAPSASTRTAPSPSSDGAGDVIGVGRHAVADELGVDPRAARAAPTRAPRESARRRPRRRRSRRGPCRTAGSPAAARRCASTARASRANPPTPIGVIAASEPPAIMTSASPRRMISNASPIACAEAEHAVQVAEFGPRAPKRIETWPAARLMMAAGMKNGEILRGPPSSSALCSRSMVVNPPMPDAMNTPTRSAISGVTVKPRVVAPRTATAAIAYWMKTSIFLTSFFSMNCSGSKPLTSPAIRVANCVASNWVIGPTPLVPGAERLPSSPRSRCRATTPGRCP